MMLDYMLAKLVQMTPTMVYDKYDKLLYRVFI